MSPRSKANIVLKALKKVRGSFAVVGAFSFFINLAALIVPLYMLQIYDRVLTAQSLETLIALTILALVLLAILVLIDTARARLLVRVGAELDATLAAPLFAKAVEDRAAELASQPLRDLETLRSFMTGAGILAFFDAPWTPIYLVIIYLFHPWLGILATLGAIVIFALALASEAAVRAPLREAGQSARWSNELIEIFARSSHAISTMGMRPQLETLWKSHRDGGVSWQSLASERLALLHATAKSVRLGLQIGVLATGAWLVLDHVTTAGIMIAASITMGRALAPIEAALGHWRGFVQARGAYQRLRAVLDDATESESRIAMPALVGRIALDNVGLRYDASAPPILSGVTFSVAAGETLAIIGPSGAGKSSLIRLIVGLQKPTLGSVRVDGVEIAAWPKDEVGPSLGYLPQEMELLGGTVGQNICRFGEPDAAAVVDAAKLVGAHEMILCLPNGYETVVDDGGRNMSGGQRQRLGLARAVYGSSQLIVLDEPTANLDGDAEIALLRGLEALKKKGRTVVIVTHKPSLVATADKLAVLADGRLKLFGSTAAVMAEMAKELGGNRPLHTSAEARRANGGNGANGANGTREKDHAETQLNA